MRFFLLLTLVTGTAAAALPPADPKGNEARAMARDQWEYGEIYTSKSRERVAWNSGTTSVEGQNAAKLSEAMVARKVIPKPVDSFYALINELGAAGWELVTVTDSSVGTSYQFKRRKL